MDPVDEQETFDEELGTVSTAAFRTLGATLTEIRHERFEQPGWFYGGTTTTKCPADGTTLHVFRRKYRSAGRDYLYAACVCTVCRSAVAAADLGLKTADLRVDPQLQQPMGEPERREDCLNEELGDFEFQALLIECIGALPTENLRQVLLSRLGIGRNALSVQEIADRQRVSEDQIRELQRNALSMLASMARRNPGSAPHKLAAKLGVTEQPRHLAVAEKVHRFVHDHEAADARERSLLWMQMAGAAESCSRHIANMVAQQVQATVDWEVTNSPA